MIVGIPKEIKDNENRVGIIPAGVQAMCRAGHTVLIEQSAGIGSGFGDEEYVRAGAEIVPQAQDVFARADLIIKVKEPLPQEYGLFKSGQMLFTFLHLAPAPELTKALCAKQVTCIAYETIEVGKSLPLLVPMSEVAGRMSIQIGAQFLEKPYGGKGVLLGGVPGVEPAQVVIVGGGIVGTNAAKIAVGLGARITVLDNSPERLRYLDDLFGSRVITVMSNSYNLARWVAKADLVVGAVLLAGAKAPKLVTEEMVQSMTPGSVIVDVAIDQGGSVATIDKVTTHSKPTYTKYGVIHYAVANMPGAVAQTATFALTNVTLDYALQLANKGWKKAAVENASLAKGLNIVAGKVTYKPVADAQGTAYTPWQEMMEIARDLPAEMIS